MESIINDICEKLIQYQIVSKKDIPIYQYGLKILLLKIAYITSFILYALLIGMLKETVLFLIVYSLLRAYGGGYHASSIPKCYVVSLTTVILNSILCKVIVTDILFRVEIILLGLSSIVICCLSPVDNHEKQLDNVEKKVYNQRAQITVGCCLFLFMMILSILNMSDIMATAVSNAVILESTMMILGEIKNLKQQK